MQTFITSISAQVCGAGLGYFSGRALFRRAPFLRYAAFFGFVCIMLQSTVWNLCTLTLYPKDIPFLLDSACVAVFLLYYAGIVFRRQLIPWSKPATRALPALGFGLAAATSYLDFLTRPARLESSDPAVYILIFIMYLTIGFSYAFVLKESLTTELHRGNPQC